MIKFYIYNSYSYMILYFLFFITIWLLLFLLVFLYNTLSNLLFLIWYLSYLYWQNTCIYSQTDILTLYVYIGLGRLYVTVFIDNPTADYKYLLSYRSLTLVCFWKRCNIKACLNALYVPWHCSMHPGLFYILHNARIFQNHCSKHFQRFAKF